VKPENLIGMELGCYRLEVVIGVGGMAAVYRALDATSGKACAVKVLFPPPGAEPDLRQRFLREAGTLARLNHPGILSVFEVDEALGHLFIAMPLVEGASLQKLLEAQGRLDETTAAEIAMQVAEALHYAHTHGIIHRDVKPSNILIDRYGRALLTDFGVARILDSPALTATGFAVGTPTYMSPEQARGRPNLDGRADLYSLGVVLYQMVTGVPPFRGSTPQVMYAHVYETPPRPSAAAEVSPAMEALILDCMAKDVEDRPASGAALALGLQRLIESTRTRQPAAMSEIAHPTPSGKMPGRLSSRRQLALGLVGLLAAASVAGGIWFAAREAPDDSLPARTSPVAAVASTSTATASPRPLPTSTRPSSPTTAPRETPGVPGGAPTATSSPAPSPTLTPSEALPPSPTLTAAISVPAPTLTACAQPLATAFAGWLDSDAGLRDQVGCPRSPAVDAAWAWEPFEGGEMVWRGDLRRIYVLDQSGAWRVYDDEWREGDIEWDVALQAPGSLYQPVRGFGLVWREEPGVRDALGWATAPETSFSATFQPAERALLVADNSTSYQWILFSDGTWLSSQ
jgi:serine/threonine-protein kinase